MVFCKHVPMIGVIGLMEEMMETRVKSQFSQMRAVSYEIGKYKSISFPVPPEQSPFVLRIVPSVWQRVTDHVNFSQSVLAVPSLLHVLCKEPETQSVIGVEFLFEKTNVFLLPNMHSRYRCD